MVRLRPIPRWVLSLVLTCAPPFLALRAPAQDISEANVKAAYLYNFAKFVEWPPQTFADVFAPIRLCVLNDDTTEAALDSLVAGKVVAGRGVTASLVHTAAEARHCQLLYLSGARTRDMLEVLHASAVVTVGDTPEFLHYGGIIAFVLDDNRVHFQINHRAATSVGLRLSSRLLSVAKLVLE